MAKFFVGQRVRIVKTYGTNNMLGIEARITALNVLGTSQHFGGKYVGHRLDVRNSKGNLCVARPGDIEPILDPGASPGIKGTCEPLDKLLSEVSGESVE